MNSHFFVFSLKKWPFSIIRVKQENRILGDFRPSKLKMVKIFAKKMSYSFILWAFQTLKIS